MKRGRYYVAEGRNPACTAMGLTVEEAAENGRLCATTILAGNSSPAMILICVEEPGRRTLTMQPFDRCILPAAARAAQVEE